MVRWAPLSLLLLVRCHLAAGQQQAAAIGDTGSLLHLPSRKPAWALGENLPQHPHKEHTCTVYHKAADQCLMTHTGALPPKPYCHLGTGKPSPCNFDAAFLNECPFVPSGSIANQTTTECSKFMVADVAEERPKCGKYCCEVDLPGMFRLAADGEHNRAVFTPVAPEDSDSEPFAGTCRYHQYNRREALDCLAGTRIAIVGDSMMRQFFNRGIALFRGQEQIVDWASHIHAAYETSYTGDSFRLQPKQTPDVRTFFHDFWFSDAAVKTDTLQINLVWAPMFVAQNIFLPEYDRQYVAQKAKDAAPPLVYVVSVGFWEREPQIPDNYLPMLDTARQNAEALIIVSVPVNRLAPEGRVIMINRNRQMREWAEARSPEAGGNVYFLDFQSMSTAPFAPQPAAGMNWHYQCAVDGSHSAQSVAAVGPVQHAASWHWDNMTETVYPSVWVGEEGSCEDEMNRNLWTLLFNLLCNLRS